MERLHAIVHGRVQGVSFRAYTEMSARNLNLVGWVRNRPDGTVETIAEGETQALESLLAFLHVGSPSAWVEEVIVTCTPITSLEFTTFETRYSR